MTTFFILVFLVYSALLLVLTWGWLRLEGKKNLGTSPVKQRLISVIIPFRNEAACISSMLKNLAAQSYSKEKIEIILVDDHSTDVSVSLAMKEALPYLIILQLPSGENGKKAALDLGIRQAKGEIIAISDMDCRVPSGWLAKINEGFSSENIKMLTGAVRMEQTGSLFSRMQSLEFSSLIGTGGATLGWAQPTMCNGANLSFLKSAYEEVRGYEGNATIPSGDDEFLMRKIAARWKDSVQFLHNREAVVSTSAHSSFNEFVHQRLRWGSKWRHNSSFFTKVVALSVIEFHFCFLLFFMAVLTGKVAWTDALLLWFIKMVTEALFLAVVGSFLGLRWSWISFLLLQFTHSFYVVGIGILSQVKSYNWKGRRWDPVKTAPSH